MALHKYHIPGEDIHKFHAKRAEVDGLKFASRAEARRYQDLLLLLAAGEIHDLKCQVRYPLVVNEVKIGTYVCDFQYRDCDGKQIVEDVKGVATQVFKIKCKLMRALYHIEILVTGGST